MGRGGAGGVGAAGGAAEEGAATALGKAAPVKSLSRVGGFSITRERSTPAACSEEQADEVL